MNYYLGGTSTWWPFTDGPAKGLWLLPQIVSHAWMLVFAMPADASRRQQTSADVSWRFFFTDQ
jgi:hypothetical protein